MDAQKWPLIAMVLFFWLVLIFLGIGAAFPNQKTPQFLFYMFGIVICIHALLALASTKTIFLFAMLCSILWFTITLFAHFWVARNVGFSNVSIYFYLYEALFVGTTVIHCLIKIRARTWKM